MRLEARKIDLNTEAETWPCSVREHGLYVDLEVPDGEDIRVITMRVRVVCVCIQRGHRLSTCAML